MSAPQNPLSIDKVIHGYLKLRIGSRVHIAELRRYVNGRRGKFCCPETVQSRFRKLQVNGVVDAVRVGGKEPIYKVKSVKEKLN